MKMAIYELQTHGIQCYIIRLIGNATWYNDSDKIALWCWLFANAAGVIYIYALIERHESAWQSLCLYVKSEYIKFIGLFVLYYNAWRWNAICCASDRQNIPYTK